MADTLKLSILDQSPIRKGGSAQQALQETVELAQLAEKLGYERFWVSEHHNISALAGSAPEVLIPHLANHTNKIKLGSGGIMLPNHSALKVAENFRMLETLFPGRIDLGVGRAPGGDRLTSHLLNPSNTFSEQDFVQQLEDLQAYLTDQGQVKAIPVAPSVPDLWVLSSSGQSALFAAQVGMGFSFAHFINPNGGPDAVRWYRNRFKPSELLKEPKVNMAIFVLCAETEEKAFELQKNMDIQLLLLAQGKRRDGYPAYEEIKDYRYSDDEKKLVLYNRQRMVCGTPEQVKQRLTQLAQEYGIDEIMAVTITHSFADRCRSYELLAKEFKLQA
ncbi:MAG: LLM class flavin-dependent oxidoreductase [Hymenobacteraceae bacterium]|nr:LLM class flavin-dependent oxidoreductase [Hymenobacteraceae bacterium]MDX5394852.1 LLM class flavin-dependent oxidoreductase [Hymenobacteraceae bacterium]MDX5510886.1 LLM class flavin-dependent oxidoreductase [Hymenobacteraceae bacterium]